jgi:hypothetical protein
MVCLITLIMIQAVESFYGWRSDLIFFQNLLNGLSTNTETLKMTFKRTSVSDVTQYISVKVYHVSEERKASIVRVEE